MIIIIDAAVVVTMDAERRVLRDGSVLIDDARISAVGDRRQIRALAADAQVIDCRQHIVLPGLVSTHAHAFQSLGRGLADAMTVEDWYLEMVLPMGRRMRAAECRLAAELTILEMIRTGTTCFVDSHFLHHDSSSIDAVAAAAEASGIRAQLVRASINRLAPPDFHETPAAASREARRCIGAWHGAAAGRIRMCPEALSAVDCDDALIGALHDVGTGRGVGFHMHAAESQAELRDVRRQTGRGVIEHLFSLGVLGPQTLLAHCVWVAPSEITLLAATGTAVAHNPVSNMFLADGVAPLRSLLDAGVTVGVGVDGASSNNSQDLFEAMKLAALLQRGTLLDPQAIDAVTALELGTIRAARAARWDHDIGSLEPGKRADLIACTLRRPAFAPDLRPISSLVFAGSGSGVELVMVDGRFLMRDGVVLTLDEPRILAEATSTARRLVREASLDAMLDHGAWRPPCCASPAGS